MSDLDSIRPGLSYTVQHQVSTTSTASHLVSGAVEVLGTPELVRLMEEAAFTLLAEYVPPDSTTVGVAIDMQHLAPTPVGLSVQVTATLTHVNGRSFTFDVVAHDDVEQIGRATHKRVMVNQEKFMEGAKRKLHK